MAEWKQRHGVLLDVQPLWLEAVERVLEGVSVDVVGATTSAAEALELIAEHRPDLFVAGLSPADEEDGIEAIRRAREISPETRVIALASDDDPSRVEAAFQAGATAYALKTVQPADLASAVRQAFGSSVYFATSPLMRRPAPPPRTPDVALTRRELEILRLVAEGHSNGQLARMLWVTEQTVKFHLSNIYRKLDVSNRTEASRWAQLHGLLSADGSETAGTGPNISRGVIAPAR